MNMFFVAGIGVAVFIEFLLITKKNKSDADKILTLWMFLIVIHFFSFYAYYTGDFFSFPSLLGLELPLPMLHGVFLYLYTATLTDQLPKKRSWLLLHFVPVSAMYLYLISFYMLPADQKIFIYKNRGAGFEVFDTIKFYAIVCSGILYVVWSGVLLKKHRRNIREQFSDLEKVNLQWLSVLTIGLGCIWFLVIFFGNDSLIFSGVVVFIFLIGFFGTRQGNIFSHVPISSGEVVENVNEEKEEGKEKYQKSGLTEEASKEIHEKLLRLMMEESLYKKSDLAITDLSARLGIHTNYLSQIINEREGKNFYDFVNTYRVEEFKRLLDDPKNRNLTLLSLAFDCGFNSKSSFNRFFKKATGQTPSEYFETLVNQT
ncbi:MAG: helix-turn-helix domain-containing protein [Bacteroidota bacterium]